MDMNSGALVQFQLHHYYFVCRTMIGENDTRCVSVHVHIDFADICIKFQKLKMADNKDRKLAHESESRNHRHGRGNKEYRKRR